MVAIQDGPLYLYARIRLPLSVVRGPKDDFEFALDNEIDEMARDMRRLAERQRDALLREGTTTRA